MRGGLWWRTGSIRPLLFNLPMNMNGPVIRVLGRSFYVLAFAFLPFVPFVNDP